MEIKLDVDVNQVMENLMDYAENEMREQVKSQIAETIKFQMSKIDFFAIVNEQFNAVVSEVVERRIEQLKQPKNKSRKTSAESYENVTKPKDIKRLIKEKGLYLYNISNELGITDATLSRWLRTPVSEEHRKKIIKAIIDITKNKEIKND